MIVNRKQYSFENILDNNYLTIYVPTTTDKPSCYGFEHDSYMICDV